MRPNLARHGPILPFAWFGGLALLDTWDGRLSRHLKGRLAQATYPIIAIAAALLIGVAAFFNPLLNGLGLPATSLSQDDVAAMTWLRGSSTADAIVLAADGDAWLPLFSERRAPDFRAVRYFEWELISSDIDVDRPEVDYVYVPGDAAPPANMPLKLAFEQRNARVYEVV